MKRTTAFFLAILMITAILASAGCGKPADDPPVTTEEITTAPPVTEPPKDEGICINGMNIGKYRLVKPTGADNDETYAASVICSAFRDILGSSVTVDEECDYTDGPAIFIGNTGAFEKTGLECPASGYAIYPKDGNVYIVGGGGYEVRGAKRFAGDVIPADGSADSDFRLTEKISYDPSSVKYPSLGELGDLPVAVVDQKNACATVYDMAPVIAKKSGGEGDGEPVRKYVFAPTKENGFTVDSTYGNRIDDFRIRYVEKYGYLAAFTSSSGYIGLAEYPSGKAVWFCTLSGYGPHSAEILPNGWLAAATSGNGNESKAFVRVYTHKTKRSLTCAAVQTDGCHAVLWDEAREILWVLGSKIIRAFEVGGTDSEPTLKELSLYRAEKSLGGHDMTAFAGDSDRLFVSGSGAYVYNKTNNKFETDFINSVKGLSSTATKCLCSILYPSGDKTGMVIFKTVATNVYASHDTDTLNIFFSTAGGFKAAVQRFSGSAFYKARIVDPYYN